MGAFILAYLTVLAAELVGDKSLYAIASLSMHLSALSVLTGAVLAFMLKMLVAVLLGSALSRIPPAWTALLSSAGFATSALLVIRRSSPAASRQLSELSHRRAVAVSGGSLLLAEWADAGQLAAAALSAQTGAPAAVWLGGTLALLSKALVALFVGRRLGPMLPDRALRFVTSGTLSILAAVSLVRGLRSLHGF